MWLSRRRTVFIFHNTMVMKTLILFSAVLVSSGLLTFAQNAKGGQVLMELQGRPRAKEQKTAALSTREAGGEIMGRKVTYGGYLAALRRAERKRQLFDLRAPADETKDIEHVAFYPGAEKVQGLIFFSIKF
jgi:hypothetical protein